MMTDYEIMHILIGMSVWLFTWELFFGQYFYTKSEKEIIRQSRGEDGFGVNALLSNLILLWVMGIVFFKIIKHIY